MGYISGRDMLNKAIEMRRTSHQLLHDQGPEVAADWLASEQYKIIGELLDNGQITTEESLCMVAEVDGYKADFLSRHKS